MKAEGSISRKVCLIVIDGWGLSVEGKHLDSIKDAHTPTMDDLCNNYPMIPLTAHGLHVGLPEGLMGNSEVGHLNIGAGRVVYQDIVRIELAIQNKEWRDHADVHRIVEDSKRSGNAIHLIGLVSDGGVHSHIEHLKALLVLLKDLGCPHACIHAITDGRDVGPQTALKYLEELQNFLNSLSFGQISTVIGRYYAMDRDKRWERTTAANDLFTEGKGSKYRSLQEIVDYNYSKGVNDEFFTASVLPDFQSIQDASGVICFNFRSDRMRQIVASFLGLAEVERPGLKAVRCNFH